jgi:hypothetical protein
MSSFFAAPSVRRRIQVAAGLSILLHVVVLSIPGRNRINEQMLTAGDPPPMSVVIVNIPSPAAAAPEPAAPVAPVTEPSPVPRPTPPKRPRPDPVPKVPDTVAKAAPAPAPQPAPQPTPQPTPPPMDMAAMIEARRAQRRAYEKGALAEAQRRDEGAQVGEGTAAQAIERNLGSLAHGSEGTSGVFQILRKGERTAEFAFNGWKPDSSRRWREVIEVDAGVGGDVELAIIRRMIGLIREHYKGDFNWQSYRLGKVIVLSARVEDNAALEDFMAREFFGTPIIKRTR